MPRKPTKNYLRKYRLQAALSQYEVSVLLGISTNTLSRYELGVRVPSADVVVASEILFGVGGALIFPTLYNGIGEELPARARALLDRIEGGSDAATQKKLALINGIPNRVR